MTLDAGSPDIELLIVTATEFEAQTKAVVLRDAGIECKVTVDASRGGTGASSVSPSPHRAAIQVRSVDLDAAKQILAEAGAVDWEATDVGDPTTAAGLSDSDEDVAPIHRARMPLLARVGWVIAALIVVSMLLIAMLALVFT